MKVEKHSTIMLCGILHSTNYRPYFEKKVPLAKFLEDFLRAGSKNVFGNASSFVATCPAERIAFAPLQKGCT